MEEKKKRKLNKKTRMQLKVASLIVVMINIALWTVLTYIASKYLETKWVIAVGATGIAGAVFMLWLAGKKHVLALILNIMICVGLILGDLAAVKVSGVTDDITVVKNVYTVKLVTTSESKLKSSDDFLGLSMGVIQGEDYYTTWMESILSDNKKSGYYQVEYESYIDMWNDLLNGNIDMCILSSIGEPELEEALESEDENVISSFEYKVIYEDRQEEVLKNLDAVNVSSQGFTVLINGVDLSGTDINKNARADVNILLTVNPTTGRINIQVLPRDLWVELPCKDNKMTKLTRASQQGGTQCSIDAIEQYFDGELTINYYVKINFTGFVDLVDAVGGIEVYSQYTYSVNGYSFKKGMNKMDGAKALQFCRERKKLPENDVSRGKNQMRVIQAIMEKFLQNPSLDKMNKILDTLSGNMVTSFSQKDFVSLFNMLIKLKDKMVIESNSMKGDTNHWAKDPIYGTKLYYFVADEGEKEAALQRIKDTLSGVVTEE